VPDHVDHVGGSAWLRWYAEPTLPPTHGGYPEPHPDELMALDGLVSMKALLTIEALGRIARAEERLITGAPELSDELGSRIRRQTAQGDELREAMGTEADRILAMAAEHRVYLVFAGARYYPSGGADDYVGIVQASTDAQAIKMAEAMAHGHAPEITKHTPSGWWWHVARQHEAGHLEVVHEVGNAGG
jgi:hypothetical protein